MTAVRAQCWENARELVRVFDMMRDGWKLHERGDDRRAAAAFELAKARLLQAAERGAAPEGAADVVAARAAELADVLAGRPNGGHGALELSAQLQKDVIELLVSGAVACEDARPAPPATPACLTREAKAKAIASLEQRADIARENKDEALAREQERAMDEVGKLPEC